MKPNLKTLKELLEKHPQPVYNSQINTYNLKKWFEEFTRVFYKFEKQLRVKFEKLTESKRRYGSEIWGDPAKAELIKEVLGEK